MSRRALLILVTAGVAVVVAGLVGVVLATSGGSERLTVYTARSHYGDEVPFKDYAKESGVDITLFGGEASELYERLRSEGKDTKADVLITVDAANLWRASEEGLLKPIRSPAIERNVPASLRDPQGRWFGLTVRARTIMRSTRRVPADAVTTYAGLGAARWKDRLCLRSGTSDYNISFVADRIAKDGLPAVRRMLERWMANDPQILGSDVDVLKAIDAGRCDVGLTNTYYLGRELADDEDFAVAPVWADQDGRGTHVNLSGIGVVKAGDRSGDATDLVKYLTAPARQRTLARNNHEFGVDPGVRSTPEVARFGSFTRDPIDVRAAGRHLGDAVRLMSDVGWD